MARITEEQLQLLETAVDAYWSNEDGQRKHDFYFSTGMGAGTGLQHPALGEDERAVDVGDIEELANLGLFSVSWQGDLNGTFRPTAEGKGVVEEQRQNAELASGQWRPTIEGPGVSWEVIQPVLKEIVELYDTAGPGEDVPVAMICERLGREEDDPGVSRAIEVLIKGEYVESKIGAWQRGPLVVAPTARALEMFAGWPTSGDAAAAKLLAILDERIERAPDEEQKGKLQRLRESVVDIGESVTAEVLVKLMTG